MKSSPPTIPTITKLLYNTPTPTNTTSLTERTISPLCTPPPTTPEQHKYKEKNQQNKFVLVEPPNLVFLSLLPTKPKYVLPNPSPFLFPF